MWIKLFIAGIVVLIIAAFIIYFYVYNKPHQDYEKAKPEYVLTANELFDFYIDNQTDAEAKYNGKVLLITGILSSVEQSQDMIILNFSFTDGLFGEEGVRCTMLENHAEKAKNLLAGTEVSVKGLCNGFTGSDVILEFCSIQ